MTAAIYVPGTSETDLSKVIMSLQAIAARSATQREVLTAARTYYVDDSLGSDANDGSITLPFKTTQHAIDVAAALDSSIYDITITHAAATYANGSGLTAKTMVGAGRIILVGDETTPGNVTFAHATANAIGISSRFVPTIYETRGIKFTSTASGIPFAIEAQGAVIRTQNCDFGSGWLHQIRAIDFGAVVTTGNITVSASPVAGGFCLATSNGMVRILNGSVVSIPNALAFSVGGAFATATRAGVILCSAALGTTISGAGFAGSTGLRYDVEQNSVIAADGGGAAFFPGDVAGTATDGSGIYS